MFTKEDHKLLFSDLILESLINDGRKDFLVMSPAYYDRTCLWSADILNSVWQENLSFH